VIRSSSFLTTQKKKIDQTLKVVAENAHKRLREILGSDYALIKNLRLDADVGKFYAVDVPEEVIEKIRAAGLLKT
jgi:hypothetical protein